MVTNYRKYYIVLLILFHVKHTQNHGMFVIFFNLETEISKQMQEFITNAKLLEQ